MNEVRDLKYFGSFRNFFEPFIIHYCHSAKLIEPIWWRNREKYDIQTKEGDNE